MRDKESIDTERKRASANLEKAAKAIERLTDMEKNLSIRVVCDSARSVCLVAHLCCSQGVLEKEIIFWKKIAEEQKARGDALEVDVMEWRYRAQGERRVADEVGFLAA